MQISKISSIGIDFGSQKSVIAVTRKGGVEILANEGSHRETQNIIGYSDKERFLGEQAALQFKSNFKNTVNFFSRFIGLQGRPPYIKQETRWLTAQNDLNANGQMQFTVRYHGDTHQLLPEQLTATMLNKLKEIVDSNGIALADSNVVLSVPAYYTEQERKALLDACRIAELPIDRLFNETTALATSYGLFRKADLDATTPRYVAFVDVGHCKTSAFVGAFYKHKAQIVAQVHDRNFGARDLDWALFEHYCELFQGQSGGLSPKESKKAQIRLLEAIEKQRKVLSVNSEAQLNVEFLVEDVDFSHTLTRDQFQKLVEPQLEQFYLIVDQLATQVRNMKINLHSVEIVGGGTRIPIMQTIIAKCLQVQSISKTLNASESIARGCAMMAASMNPSFRVTEYSIEDAQYHPIRVGWLYNTTLDEVLHKMDIEQVSLTTLFPEKQRPLLFESGCSVPSVKSFTLSKTDPFEITVFYDTPPPGFHSIIMQVRVPAIKPTHPDHHTKIKLRVNQNGLIQLDDVQLIEEFMEKQEPLQEEAPPSDIKSDKSSKSSKIKRQHQTPIKCDVSNFYTMLDKQVQDYFEVEATMINQDSHTQETYGHKNALEAYIYKMKDHLAGRLKDFTKDGERIMQQLDEQHAWLYGEGAHSTKQQYGARLEQQKLECDPILQRYQDYTETLESVDELLKVIHQSDTMARNGDHQHMTQEQRNRIHDEGHAARVWSKGTLEKVQRKDKSKDCDVNQSDVQKYQQGFVERTQAILNQPVTTKRNIRTPPPEQKMETE